MNDGDRVQYETTISLGRYRLLKQIGKGGMGEVWLGEDPRLHRQVAIKTLPVHKQQDDEFLLRFEREARAAAALNHPHILPIHDFGKQVLPDDQFTTYIVMPYITGGTLADRIEVHNANHTLMPQQEALTYLSQAAEAIDHAHKHGVIHRDIKPANMLLRNDNWLLLGDFGIAHLSNTENITRTGIGTGTPEYIAPEQAQGRAEAASDIYGLAVLAYYLFTGKVPFKAISNYGTIVQHITSAPPPPRQVNATLSQQQAQALLHGLAKRPAERPASASALVEELQRASGGTQANVSAPVPPQPTPPNPSTRVLPPRTLASDSRLPITEQSLTPAFAQNSTPPATEHTSQIRGTFHRETLIPPKKQISRRNLLIGGGAALAVLAGGTGTWTIMRTQKPDSPGQPTTTAADPNGPDLILHGHTKPVTSLAWSTQSQLASAAEDGAVLLWTPQQSQQQQSIKPAARQTFHGAGPLLLSWSLDGQWLAIGNTGKGTTASVEVYTGDLQKTAPGYNAALSIPGATAIAGMAWQKRYLVAATAQPALQLNVWNTQQPQQQLDPIMLAGSLSTELSTRSPLLLASPDGSQLALAEKEGVITGEIQLAGTTAHWQQILSPVKLNGQIKAMSWMPSGAVMGALTTTNDQTFSLDLWTMKQAEHNALHTDAVLTTLAWSPAATSDLVATGCKDGQVLIWQYGGSNIPIRLNSHVKAAVISLAWSTDGQWLAAGFNDKDASILIWNIQERGL